MNTRRLAAACLQLTAVVLLLSGCAPATAPDAAAGSTGRSRTTVAPTPASTDPAPSPTRNEEATMNILITVGDQRLTAVLDGSAASQDLLGQLPVTVRMSDHGGVEKTGQLPGPLSLDGRPDVGDPAVGDVGYYAPGQDLVLYYGNQSAYPGIVVLGRMDGDAAERLATIDGPVTVTVEGRPA